MTAQEFDVLSPLPEEIEWARERCRGRSICWGWCWAEVLSALGLLPSGGAVPEEVIERVRTAWGWRRNAAGRGPAHRGVAAGANPGAGRRGVRPRACSSSAEQAIRAEAEIKNHPPDLINVALELLVREGLELPGFSTLNEIAARVGRRSTRGCSRGSWRE